MSAVVFSAFEMSPRKLELDGKPAAERQLDRLLLQAGIAIGEARVRRGWTLSALAARSGVSIATAHAAQNGGRVSLEMMVRLSAALGLRPELILSDGRARTPSRDADTVHAAMAEVEAKQLRPAGFPIAIDEPYQHYQFAGRADLLAWDLERRALLHCENRTLFPDMQDTAGTWNAKRAYLAPVLATRLEITGWRSVTHVMVGLWSSEVLHSVRIRTETFRALCPQPSDGFAGWWSGAPPERGTTSTFILLDPLADGRQRRWVDFEAALTARPRVASYRDAAERLRQSGMA